MKILIIEDDREQVTERFSPAENYQIPDGSIDLSIIDRMIEITSAYDFTLGAL